MMTVQTTNFQGTLTPAVLAPYTVRCVTCRAVVEQGAAPVDTTTLLHTCSDTTSGVREYEVVWDTVDVAETELPREA
jgi:hypothetical protein